MAARRLVERDDSLMTMQIIIRLENIATDATDVREA